MHVRLTRAGRLASSVMEDLDYLSQKFRQLKKRAPEGLTAIRNSAGEAEVNDEDIIDLVNKGTPSSCTPPLIPPSPPRERVLPRTASKSKNGPTTKNP